MIVKYPKNIFQSILLLLVGLTGTLPLVFIQETKVINLAQELYQPLIFSLLFVSASFFYYYKNKRHFSFSEVWKIKSSLKTETWVLLLIFLLVFQVGINVPLIKFISFRISTVNNIVNPIHNLSIAIGAIILAPIYEEFIFRGMILNGFLYNYNSVKAIVFSSIIFCLAHIQPTLLPGAFLLGLLLGYLFYLTRSVLPSMFFHALANAVTLFAGYYLYLLNGKNRMEAVYGHHTLLVVIVSVLICVAIAIKYTNHMRKIACR